MGVPLVIIYFDGIFPEINHPFWGTPRWQWKPHVVRPLVKPAGARLELDASRKPCGSSVFFEAGRGIRIQMVNWSNGGVYRCLQMFTQGFQWDDHLGFQWDNHLVKCKPIILMIFFWRFAQEHARYECRKNWDTPNTHHLVVLIGDRSLGIQWHLRCRLHEWATNKAEEDGHHISVMWKDRTVRTSQNKSEQVRTSQNKSEQVRTSQNSDQSCSSWGCSSCKLPSLKSKQSEASEGYCGLIGVITNRCPLIGLSWSARAASRRCWKKHAELQRHGEIRTRFTRLQPWPLLVEKTCRGLYYQNLPNILLIIITIGLIGSLWTCQYGMTEGFWARLNGT